MIHCYDVSCNNYVDTQPSFIGIVPIGVNDYVNNILLE